MRDQTNLVLNSVEKVKPGFLLSLKCECFLNRTGQNSDLTAYTSKIQVFCRPECTIGPQENEFWQFSNTKMNITDS